MRLVYFCQNAIMRTHYLFFIAVLFLPWGCRNTTDEKTLFHLVDKAHHGITFQNTISENDSLNILTLEYIYNGGGVAAGDFNNDGRCDLFFTGNMVPSKLYINRGDLKFEDVSEKAGILPSDKWRSGVAVADVNGDGLLDIYVCATIKPDSSLRANTLFINQGISADGIPTFKDQAQKYGVAFGGHSSGAAFLDYDNDGDLDLYILTNTIQKGIPTSYRAKANDGTSVNTDCLLRNNGNETFTDVSKEAGIVHEGYGLGLAIADINQDGWQDIYVSNDYITNDLLYLNNRNGTFTNAIDQCIRHQSQFSMGNDIADINNDGLPDIITLDMLPEGNLRRKTVISGTNYTSYINNRQFGYSHQYIRNMLQLNNGNGSFSEIGQLAGIHQTEWSWSPLLADFDNDGFRDVIITNGFPRDITDKDFGNFRSGPGGNIASIEFLLDSIPVVKISNYAFRNNGDLTFTDVTRAWGMHQPAFSNGAAFADFDEDGDLDYVVNNINGDVLFYENGLYSDAEEVRKDHYLRVKLIGEKGNITGLGARIMLHYDGKLQYHDHSVYRGYISSVEPVAHFGLDSVTTVDTVLVQWPDGRSSLLKNVKADQVLTIKHAEAGEAVTLKKAPHDPLMKDVAVETGIKFVHTEDDKIDFNVQRTIPHKFSQSGPGIAVGDVTNDGLEDFYIGGAANRNGTLFIQRRDGTFASREIKKSASQKEEDQGSLFFDSDNDGDLDLYVVSGTFEYAVDSEQHQDRLYVNDGKGNFTLNPAALPVTTSSGSCVRAADIDGDGDLDLFVGGRIVPWRYPYPAESYILVNEQGRFVNKTDELCAGLKTAGMITDALWTDFDNDGKVDLIVTGEFMPLTAYRNEGAKLTKLNDSGLEQRSGWWNSISTGDFDKDGDMDYIAGNLGLNNYYKASTATPLKVYAKDFDGNNSVDAVLTCYLRSEEGEMKEYPVHFWDELNSQSPKFRRKFNYYKRYGRATIDQVLTGEELKDALIMETNYTASSYIENLGGGKFAVTPLPMIAQIAPVNGIVTADVNDDGNLDVLMTGNDYGNEVFTGRHDAFTGLILMGNGAGKFTPVSPIEGGFIVPRDGKALARLSSAKGELFIATQNQDTARVYAYVKQPAAKEFSPEPYDAWAVLIYGDGAKQKVEFYYGAGYLAQSTRRIRVPQAVRQIVVHDTKGNTRTVGADSL